ncbi:MAG TPA: CopG family transcriptional regulator [Vitreimonas sp.]|nr:CopG family transcriptional regulator [Vitreimonas sp.]
MAHFLKRLTIRLNHSLDAAFTTKAKKVGISKSKLLRQWLQEDLSTLQLFSTVPMTKTVSYSCALSDDDFTRLSEIADRFHLSHTKLIQVLIENKTQVKPLPSAASSSPLNVSLLSELLNQGHLREVTQLYTGYVEGYSVESLFSLLEANFEMGNGEASHQLLNLLHEKISPHHQTHSLLLTTYKAYYLMSYYRDLKKSTQLLDQVEPFIAHIQDRQFLGIYYRIKGLLAYYSDDILNGIQFLDRSIDYLDPIYYQRQFLYSAVELLKIYTGQCNWEMVKLFHIKIQSLLDRHPNVFFTSWFNRHKTLYYLSQRNYQTALDLINESVRCDQISGSRWALSVTYREKAKILLALNRKAEAIQYFQNSSWIDTSFRPHVHFSRSKLYSNFMSTELQNESAFKCLENLTVSNSQSVEPSLGSYVYYTAQFLHGNTKKERLTGEQGLKSLTAHGAYSLIKTAAKETLTKHQFETAL